MANSNTQGYGLNSRWYIRIILQSTSRSRSVLIRLTQDYSAAVIYQWWAPVVFSCWLYDGRYCCNHWTADNPTVWCVLNGISSTMRLQL